MYIFKAPKELKLEKPKTIELNASRINYKKAVVSSDKKYKDYVFRDYFCRMFFGIQETKVTMTNKSKYDFRAFITECDKINCKKYITFPEHKLPNGKLIKFSEQEVYSKIDFHESVMYRFYRLAKMISYLDIEPTVIQKAIDMYIKGTISVEVFVSESNKSIESNGGFFTVFDELRDSRNLFIELSNMLYLSGFNTPAINKLKDSEDFNIGVNHTNITYFQGLNFDCIDFIVQVIDLYLVSPSEFERITSKL